MHTAPRDWLVVADDRTGASEVAAELAAPGAAVFVTVGAPPAGNGVVDLATRGMEPSQAASEVVRLMAAVGVVTGAGASGPGTSAVPDGRRTPWRAHKMDSTLRGNWPHELREYGTRVLIVPAWPAMGRTCAGGVVHVHGRPVGALADHLPEVVHLATTDELAAWLVAGTGIAAVDVPDDATLHAVAVLSAPHDVLVAGPAGPIGACFRSRAGVAVPARPPVEIGSARPLPEPIVVVVGSASEVAAAQVARLRSALPQVEVIAAPAAEGPLDRSVAARLVEGAASSLARARTVVVVGGDTAAALLGDGARLVGGYAAPGMPWSVDAAGGGPVVVSKAGSFGGPDALVDLLSGPTTGPAAGGPVGQTA